MHPWTKIAPNTAADTTLKHITAEECRRLAAANSPDPKEVITSLVSDALQKIEEAAKRGGRSVTFGDRGEREATAELRNAADVILKQKGFRIEISDWPRATRVASW